jgi:hypothetical protein
MRLALALAVLALPLMSCGKKGPPEPPAGEPLTYPRSYPYDPTEPPPSNPKQQQQQQQPQAGLTP